MWSSHKPKLSGLRHSVKSKMGTPSSLPTNPNPNPSPPLPQSPPPQTPPLPQSPPPQSPPPPPSQIPPLIPPTPLSPQSEPPNETPITDTHSPEPTPEPVPTRTKTKGKTKRAADTIEEVISPLPWAFRDMDMKKAYEKLLSKNILANKYMDEQILNELGIYDSVFAYLDVVSWIDFAKIREPVYKDLTLEFLSSLKLSFKPTVPEHKDMIYFRCAGIDRELDMGALNAIFGFQDSGYKNIEWQRNCL
ncbi:uncharacterized protein LOC131171115 [Hevea brasiliensis]|uniref:uncharacterized protein LOC131171115 n=1 Tax=Hevea brasiliensis TaxID=3981 RepID=UPI0025FCF8C9|nr:uncharacterized protein LOC131171115 [Hevea brasiliensis]